MADLINSREYASSNIHNIININNTVNNNNYTESKDNNFKGFYESFSNSNSKNKLFSKDIIKLENNNSSLVESKEKNENKNINKEIRNSDKGNITIKDIEQ